MLVHRDDKEIRDDPGLCRRYATGSRIQRVRRCKQRQADGEGRARPHRRFNLDPPLVGIHELTGDEKSPRPRPSRAERSSSTR